MKTILVLAMFICLGCTTTYVHPSKSNMEFYKESSQCEATSGQAAQGMGGYAYLITKKRVYRDCMAGNGWEEQ